MKIRMTPVQENNLSAAKSQKEKKIRNSYSKFPSFRVFPRVGTNWSECPNHFLTVQDDDNVITSAVENRRDIF